MRKLKAFSLSILAVSQVNLRNAWGYIMKDTANIILRTINFMEEHLKDDLKLNDIAKFTGYSKYHLNRIFTETVGCTMHKYIQKRRLTEAAKQLVYTNIPIIEIALEAKYDSQQAFTLAFRQVYLQTPLNYRANGIFVPLQSQYGILHSGQKSCVSTVFYLNNYTKKEMAA